MTDDEQNETANGERAKPTTRESERTTTRESDTIPADALRAVVAARDTDTTPDTTEIRRLAAAAGYAVVEEVTQRRREDPTYGLGRGKAEALMRLAADCDADAVIYDGELSPGQTYSLGELLPTGTAVVDRPRVVMERFADAADSRAADLQLRLARLRYERPRLQEAIARDHSEEVRLRPEGDSRVLDIDRQIESAERALDALSDDRADRRASRREAGFDLVAVVGYTNAGKSRLCRRLADEFDDAGRRVDADPNRIDGVDTNRSGGVDTESTAERRSAAGSHADLGSTLATGDRLFETLSTTTHEATMDGRRTLVTDTVGFIDDLPHDAIRSFRTTIEAAREADCVLLVVDASDEPSTLRRKLWTSLSAVETTAGPVIPVVNKVDRLDATVLEAVVETVEAVVDDAIREELPIAETCCPPIPTSAQAGTGFGDLRTAVADALPTATETVDAPNGSQTEAALSWAYDRGVVEDTTYTADGVRITLAGRPAVVAAAARRLDRS